MNKLLSLLANPPVEFRPVPFWFMNHCPEEKLIREQIQAIHKAGFGGVMLHARNGLLPCEYLNERWRRTVSTVLDEVKRLGMKLWLYDELQYPSGPAGGRILDMHPDKPLQYLVLEYEGDNTPKGKFDRIVETDCGFMAFNVRTQNQYPDYLDKKTMADFVTLSYRWYAEKFGDDFGSIIPGEFTDNACGNFGAFRRSMPWTPAMPSLFKDKTGIELDKVIPSLFKETQNAHLHRLLFWCFFNELFLETYIIPIENECARNGIAATGHYCIEDGTSEHVRQLGDRFEQKKHQHLPGVDMLGAGSFEGNADFPLGTPTAMIGMTASPAYFYHGSRVLCECLGLTQEWGMTLAEALRMCSVLSALGIDMFVPHGMFYSIAGNRKRECVPDFLHNPMLEFLPILTRKLSQLSMLSSHSLHIAETALLYPLTAQQASIQLLDGPGLRHGNECAEIDAASRHAADALIANAIPFEFISEDIISDSQVIGDELAISLPSGGKHIIRSIIMPSAWIIGKKALAVLEKFKCAGGLIMTISRDVSATFDGDVIAPASLKGAPFDIAQLRGNMLHSRLSLSNTNGKILLREWIKDGQYFAMIQNFSRESLHDVEFNCKFDPAELDLERGHNRRLPKSFLHDFDYGDTFLLTEADELSDLPAQPYPSIHKDELHEFKMQIREWRVEPETPNALVMDSITATNTLHSRTWQCRFSIDEMPQALFLATDMEPTSDELRNHLTPFEDGQCKVYVNDHIVKNITPGNYFDRWMPEAEITTLVRTGENVISFVHSPNILLDSSRPMEMPIVFGHFGTRGRTIINAPSTLPYPRWDGTPLERYSGAMNFIANIVIPHELLGKKIWMQLEGVREIAEVFADGERIGVAVKPPYMFEIPFGCRTLRLRLVNTPANLWQTPLPSGITDEIRWFWS